MSTPDLIWTILGSGTAIASPQRGPTAHLVQYGGRSWLVDCGSGALQAAAHHVDPRTVEGVFLSHHHPDHSLDLVALAFSLRAPNRRDRPLVIWGGRGTAPWWSALERAWGRWVQPACGVRVRELPTHAPHSIELAPGLVLRTAPANHRASALHLRLDAGRTAITFSGDTGPSPALADLARGSDLLICECAAPDDAPMPRHLSPGDVAELAQSTSPGAVWLTHLYAGVDEHTAVAKVAATGVPCRRAMDGDRWPLPTP